MKPEQAALVETRILDGRPFLVIPMEGQVEVNGICIHTDVSAEESNERNTTWNL